MVWTFETNKVPTSGSDMFFTIKTMLKAKGWTVPRSSDGTTYNSTGDQITQFGAGAGGMGNNNAWFIIKSPNHNREFCFECNGDTGWRIKYSGGNGFTEGGPTATKVPSATDEAVIWGSGTDASPIRSLILDGSTLQRFYAVVGGEDEGYSFLFWWHRFGQGGIGNYIAMDAMLPNTYHPSDIDPVVVCMGNLNNSLTGANEFISSSNNIRGWIRKGLSNSGFQPVVVETPAYGTTSSINLINGFPYSGEKEALSYVTYYRPLNLSPPTGVKGISTIFRWVNRMRGYGFVMSSSPGAYDWIQWAGTSETVYFCVPWDGTKNFLSRI